MDGIHISSLQTLSREARQFYSALFSKDSPPAEDEKNLILACVPSLISKEMNDFLIHLISLPKLEEVIFG